MVIQDILLEAQLRAAASGGPISLRTIGTAGLSAIINLPTSHIPMCLCSYSVCTFWSKHNPAHRYSCFDLSGVPNNAIPAVSKSCFPVLAGDVSNTLSECWKSQASPVSIAELLNAQARKRLYSVYLHLPQQEVDATYQRMKLPAKMRAVLMYVKSPF